jgi:predicted Zn-dependent protease with MMP-like domain
MKNMAATMGGPSQRITESDTNAVALFAPTVRYVSTNDSQFDPCMDWRAELWLGHLEIVDEPDVLGGYADFLTVRLGEHPIADVLDSLSQDAENFAGLFDGSNVAESVQYQFQEPFNTVLILLTVLVAKPLRGHDLGAWLAAEVIARMASGTDTLVLLYPHPAGEPPEDVSEIHAIDALNRYWRKAGLVPIDEHPGFLGQSTAYTALPDARCELQHVQDVQIPVDTRDLRLNML